jgi:hypothetical protein
MASLGSVTRYDGRPGAQPGAGADVTILRRMVPAIDRDACTGARWDNRMGRLSAPLRTRDGYGRDPFMIGNGRQDNPDAAGVLDLHLGQTPGLRGWLSHNRGSGRGQPGVPGVNTPDLDPDHQTPGRAGPTPPFRHHVQ